MTEKQRLTAQRKLRRQLRGNMEQIARAIALETGKSYTRQAVQRWHQIPEKYAHVVERVCGHITGKTRAHYWR